VGRVVVGTCRSMKEETLKTQKSIGGLNPKKYSSMYLAGTRYDRKWNPHLYARNPEDPSLNQVWPSICDRYASADVGKIRKSVALSGFSTKGGVSEFSDILLRSATYKQTPATPWARSDIGALRSM
jgi:hypothetical protein